MFKLPDVFEVEKPVTPGNPWLEKTRPQIKNEAEKKVSFGVELAKGLQPFNAACQICGDNVAQALWISQNWLNDPSVLASKDVYLKTVDTSASLLDADQLAAKLLAMANEKNANGMFYVLEGKDRLKALELYAEIKGFKGKLAIDQSTKNVTINSIKLKFVHPEPKETKTIDNELDNSQIINDKAPIKLKLVG